MVLQEGMGTEALHSLCPLLQQPALCTITASSITASSMFVQPGVRMSCYTEDGRQSEAQVSVRAITASVSNIEEVQPSATNSAVTASSC